MAKEIKENAKDHQLIIDYIYGELSVEQRQKLEQRVLADSQFKALVERQKQFDQLIKPGSSPEISPQRVNAVHWTLHKKLTRAAGKHGLAFGKMSQRQVSLKVQFISMALTFVLGIMVAQSQFILPDSKAPQAGKTAAIQEIPLDLISNEDYQIVDLKIARSDPDNDLISVNYSLASQTQLIGNIASKDILNLLALTMKNDVSDATRLEIVEIFRDFTQTTQVRNALSYSLLNDPNPGVRMAAAESLAKLSSDALVRKVLRQALEKDINSGIRVAVFEGLIKHLDDQATLETLERSSLNDSNQYIRSQARLLVDKTTAKNLQI